MLVRTTLAQRLRARDIAKQCWVESNQDMDRARELCRSRIKSEFGSIIAYITIAAALIRIAYTLFKLWMDLKVSEPTAEPTATERRYVYANLGVRL